VRGAARFANAASALKCTRTGGRNDIPTRAEVDTLLVGRKSTIAV
jgi:sulfofructose kinase